MVFSPETFDLGADRDDEGMKTTPNDAMHSLILFITVGRSVDGVLDGFGRLRSIGEGWGGTLADNLDADGISEFAKVVFS